MAWRCRSHHLPVRGPAGWLTAGRLPVTSLGDLVRLHRKAAVPEMTQEDLAESAGTSVNTIYNIENGKHRPRGYTVTRLADGLRLTGAARARFEAVAAGVADPADGDLAALPRPADPDDPRAWLASMVAALDRDGVAAARLALAGWRDRGPIDAAWLEWVDRLIILTGEGRLQPAAQRPLPADDPGPFPGREQQAASLSGFLSRAGQGRGGLALVMGPSGIGKSRLVSRALADWQQRGPAEWVTLDRGEVGYQSWRRLLQPLWVGVRRTELAPPGLLAHAQTLDDILLAGTDSTLASGYFQRDVAEAVAALLRNVAHRTPLVLVIDDAHRGGLSSDRLILDVAQRVNASRVGLIAALRPDELDAGSPLRAYRDQGGGRAAPDVVTPVHVTPLDHDAVGYLLRERTKATPPPGVVAQVAQQTGGWPQLIQSIEVSPPPARGSAWTVGALDAQGLRLLLSIIDGRPGPVRDILRAAAVCADGRCADPDMVAQITGQPSGVVAQVLDEERRLGVILSEASGCCFQHDNWIDVLVRFCPQDTLRALHARCLELLRARHLGDARKLARHAIGAGAALADGAELAALASHAADLDAADYAFAAAAEKYEIAARHLVGPDQVRLMIRQADALRFCGRWREARDTLRQAAEQARLLQAPGLEATALIHLERLTWSYGLVEQEMTQQLRDVLARLPPGDTVLRAQVGATLAMRLAIALRQYDSEPADLARSVLQELPAVTDPLQRAGIDLLALADIVLGVRGGLVDSVPPEVLLDYDRQLLELGVQAHSAYHIGEALAARIVDLLRAGRLSELPAALRAQGDFAERSTSATVVYLKVLCSAMLALARGEFGLAKDSTDEADTISRGWGESIAREALLAQATWRLYETGETAGLTEFLQILPTQEVSSVNEHVWALGAGLIHAENGEAAAAIAALRDVCARTGDLSDLPRGPARIAVLATAAMVLGHPLVYDAIGEEMPVHEAERLGAGLAELLDGHPDKIVVAGWPAVLLGSKHRFTGLACLAAGQPARAAEHLARAVYENTSFRALLLRAQFDQARTLLQQPSGQAGGLAQLTRVRQEAEEIGMAALARQAATEQDRPPAPRT